MKAKDVMSRDVLSVDKDQRLEQVLDLMRKNRVSKLVVTEKGRAVGLVTDGDIADELGAIKNKGVPASQLHATSAMRRRFPTATPDTDVGKVVELLREDDAGMVIVLHDDHPVGVVTASDLLHLVNDGMPVSDVMTSHVHTVQDTDRVVHARRVMLDHHVERLPVLHNGKIVGILGESDLAAGYARFKDTVKDQHQPAALQRFLVQDVYNRNVVTCTPETPVHEAAKQMKKDDVGCLPVVRGDRLVGILTRGDLLKLVKAP